MSGCRRHPVPDPQCDDDACLEACLQAAEAAADCTYCLDTGVAYDPDDPQASGACPACSPRSCQKS